MQTKPKITISPGFFVFWTAMILLEPCVWLGYIAAAMAWHEAGHLICILLTGCGIDRIRFCASGVEIERRQRLNSYPADLAIALSGPICSLIGGAGLLCTPTGVRFFGAASLMLGILNALPIGGLDGGAAAYALICIFANEERARRISRALSLIFCVMLWMAAVWIMLMTGGNFSLFALSAVLFTSTAFGL